MLSHKTIEDFIKSDQIDKIDFIKNQLEIERKKPLWRQKIDYTKFIDTIIFFPFATYPNDIKKAEAIALAFSSALLPLIPIGVLRKIAFCPAFGVRIIEETKSSKMLQLFHDHVQKLFETGKISKLFYLKAVSTATLKTAVMLPTPDFLNIYLNTHKAMLKQNKISKRKYHYTCERILQKIYVKLFNIFVKINSYPLQDIVLSGQIASLKRYIDSLRQYFNENEILELFKLKLIQPYEDGKNPSHPMNRFLNVLNSSTPLEAFNILETACAEQKETKVIPAAPVEIKAFSPDALKRLDSFEVKTWCSESKKSLCLFDISTPFSFFQSSPVSNSIFIDDRLAEESEEEEVDIPEAKSPNQRILAMIRARG